jgi:hypothetical protein
MTKKILDTQGDDYTPGTVWFCTLTLPCCNGYEVRPRRGRMFIEKMSTAVVRPRRGRIKTQHLFSINMQCLRHHDAKSMYHVWYNIVY